MWQDQYGATGCSPALQAVDSKQAENLLVGKTKSYWTNNSAVLHRDWHPWENDMNVLTWHAQKEREGIKDLSREAMVDDVRNRFWKHDQSPARERERAQSVERSIEREYARTGRERTPVQTLERTPTRERTPEIPLARLTRRLGHSLGHARDDAMQDGVRVNLREQDYEQEHGYSR